MPHLYFRHGTKSDPNRVILQKPPKLPKMKKEEMLCETCGDKILKYAETKDYKYFWCDKEGKNFNIRKEVKSEVP